MVALGCSLMRLERTWANFPAFGQLEFRRTTPGGSAARKEKVESKKGQCGLGGCKMFQRLITLVAFRIGDGYLRKSE